MKRKTVGILLGVSCAVLVCGCQKAPSATQAAKESEETEKEGTGEDAETEAAIKEAEDLASEQESGEVNPAETDSDTSRGLVAISLKNNNIWDQADGESLRDGFAEKNCETFISYAQDEADLQIEQIREMLERDPKILVIDPVNPYGLSDVLEEAAQKGISIFSYNDLIMESGDVSYYITFDMRGIGQQVGRRIIDKKDLKKLSSTGEYATIEFFMGDGNDLGALFLFNGILEELQPYFEDGTLVCPSNQVTFSQTATTQCSSELSTRRYQELVEEYYPSGECPDIICTGFDGAIGGILNQLDDAGIYPDSEQYPLINGIGCETDVIRAIAEGRVSFDIYMDRRDLSDFCISMGDTVISGENPEVNNYEQYDNGTKLIRTNTCGGEYMDADNYEMLIDMGLFSQEEVEPVYAVPVMTLAPTATPIPTATPAPTATPIPTATPTITPVQTTIPSLAP